MKEFIKNNKMLIGFILLGLVGAAFYLQSRPEEQAEVTRTVNQETTSTVGADILIALNQLNTLKLDRSVFTSESFLRLRDFSRPIPEPLVGRPNPFASLFERSSSAGRSTATTSPATTR